MSKLAKRGASRDRCRVLTEAYDRLLSLASGPLIDELPGDRTSPQERGAELDALLLRRNGFYAFEAALHVFPSGQSSEVMTAETWNDRQTWRYAYQGLADGLWFFAEDAFGYQFGLDQEEIVLFDPETGSREHIAQTIGEWADLIVRDYSRMTGHAVARPWQVEHGALMPSTRLQPKMPFVLQGTYELSNLFAGDSVEGMRARGNLAVQIRDLPDGAQVEYIVTE